MSYKSVYIELKKAIIDWFMDNLNVFNRTNACREAFRQYIYDAEGGYIIGGEAVSDFIDHVDKLF